MKLKQVISFCLMLVTVTSVFAKREPDWMKSLPLPSNDSYIYVREAGEGSTALNAKNMAIIHVFEQTASRFGVSFNSQRAFRDLQSGEDYEIIAAQYNIPIHLVDDYAIKQADSHYLVYVLCQVVSRRTIMPIWETGVQASSYEDFPAMFSSMMLPGLGQIKKGRVGAGTLTLLGEVAFVGSAVTFNVLAHKQLNVMGDNVNSQNIEGFLGAYQRYNDYRTASYLSWGAAGLLYIVNIIQAYCISPKTDLPAFAYSPSIICTGNSVAPSIALSYNF